MKIIHAIAFYDFDDDYRIWSKLFLNAAIIRGGKDILISNKIKVPKY